jgi:hypothetical protein
MTEQPGAYSDIAMCVLCPPDKPPHPFYTHLRNGVPVTKAMTIPAEEVKPRDHLVVLNVTAAWIDHTREFYVRIGTQYGHITLSKCALVTVHRTVEP